MKQGDPRLLGALAYATPVASTIILGLAGFAPLSPATVVAALLVVAGGWIRGECSFDSADEAKRVSGRQALEKARAGICLREG